MTGLVKVKIKGTVITSRYGSLADGDELLTDASYAKHLIDDCGAAEYVKTGKAEAKAAEEAVKKSKSAK